MINIYVKDTRNAKREFVGTFENLNEAVITLTEARGDEDYSLETFNDCYISEEIEE